jgi:hypothetical protein
MGTISDKLMRIINTKEDIRQALISKGYDVPTSIPFKEYAKMISDLPCRVDSFPDIEGIVARYSALGLTNEQMATNPVWVDKTGNGYDLQLKNFSWKGMSGVGGYGDENHQTFYKFTLDDYVFIATPPGVKHMNFTFRVTGLQPGNKLTLAFFGTTNTVYGTWNKDGIYTVDADIVEAGKPTYFYNGYGATGGEFTIEILPLYPGALVFDGVDDYGVCENFPILTKEKGYTVVALRQWIEEKNDSTALVSNCKNWNQDGAFLFEYNNLRINFLNVAIFFGHVSSVDRGKSPFSYQTSKLYNGKNIKPGSFIGSNELVVGKGNKDFPTVSNAAIWEIVILDHDATEEELTKIKDYFVKTYPWLFPDQAWTVVGKTNEDEDRATIANITGNGNDLILSNFGFIEGSGYNEEGEYAGYLVTDGVDDKIISSIFKMGNDWTVIGDWELINTGKNDNAGIVKFDSIVIYNYNYNYNSMLINIKNGRNILIPDQNTVNAICSDGRIYSKDWKESIYNEETESTSKNFLTIGYSGNAYTKIAFKNLAIYPTVLSREDCIKAYNYLQTLKSK